MAITLNAETEGMIEHRLQRGGFGSPDDVVRAALASLDQQDSLADLTTLQLDALYPGFRDQVAAGLAQADAGHLSDGEAFFTELEREERVLADQQRGRQTA